MGNACSRTGSTWSWSAQRRTRLGLCAFVTGHAKQLKGTIMMAENTKENIPAVPEMKLELVPVPVTDVDRAKAFYEKAGFQLEVDTRPTDTMRVVQFTPPGSACSIVFGTGMGAITEMKPGVVKGLHLVLAD